MKKIFTLLAGVLLAIGAQAQTTYNLGGLQIADFTLGDAFEDGGTQVIHYTPESYVAKEALF